MDAKFFGKEQPSLNNESDVGAAQIGGEKYHSSWVSVNCELNSIPARCALPLPSGPLGLFITPTGTDIPPIPSTS